MSGTQQSDNTLDGIFHALYKNHHLLDDTFIRIDQAKKDLNKWRDEAVINAQLELLMGFRRRDFVDENMYQVAVLDRIAKLQPTSRGNHG